MKLISYILFPSKELCQGNPFKRHTQLSTAPPRTYGETEVIEVIAINCSSINQIPVAVEEIASDAVKQPLTDENLFNALWSTTCSRHMVFKPYGQIKPDYLDDFFAENNINLKHENCIYIWFEKEIMDIVSKVTSKKMQQNVQ